MDESREYNQLLNQYNRAVSNLKIQADDIQVKKKQWSEKEAYYKNLIDHAKKLCIEILAKDKDEMKLGDTYHWSKLDVIELLDKAYYSYIKYNKERTALMNSIIRTSEERANAIKLREEEIISLKSRQKASSMTKEELDEAVEREKAKKHIPEPVTEEFNGMLVEIVEESNKDVTAAEMEVYGDVFSTEATALKTSFNGRGSNITYVNSEKKEKKKAELEQQIVSSTTNIAELLNAIPDEGFEVLNQIGTFGMSERPAISEEIVKRYDYKANKVNNVMTQLRLKDIIASEELTLPLQPRVAILSLTDIGVKVYEAHFGKKPTKSEKEKLIAEHTSLEHGYGIKELAGQLKQCKHYKSVDFMTCRKKAIDVGNNRSYIPDVICEDDKGNKTYYEYELGTHSPKDFADKLNRAIIAGKVINIVGANDEDIKTKVIPKIDSWAKEASAVKGRLDNVIVRINPLKSIKNYNDNQNFNPNSNACWKYIYDFNKGLGIYANG